MKLLLLLLTTLSLSACGKRFTFSGSVTQGGLTSSSQSVQSNSPSISCAQSGLIGTWFFRQGDFSQSLSVSDSCTLQGNFAPAQGEQPLAPVILDNLTTTSLVFVQTNGTGNNLVQTESSCNYSLFNDGDTLSLTCDVPGLGTVSATLQKLQP